MKNGDIRDLKPKIETKSDIFRRMNRKTMAIMLVFVYIQQVLSGSFEHEILGEAISHELSSGFHINRYISPDYWR